MVLNHKQIKICKSRSPGALFLSFRNRLPTSSYNPKLTILSFWWEHLGGWCKNMHLWHRTTQLSVCDYYWLQCFSPLLIGTAGYSWQSWSHGFTASTSCPCLYKADDSWSTSCSCKVDISSHSGNSWFYRWQWEETWAPHSTQSGDRECLNSSYLGLLLFLNIVVGNSLQIE